MNDPVIKSIKDRWLDCEKLSEKDEALLFARIEKLEDELAAQQGVQADGAKCACPEPQISTLVNPGFCIICKLPRR